MDDARNVAQAREHDVDNQVSAAATLEEHTKRWEDDGEDDLDDVAATLVSTGGLNKVALRSRDVEEEVSLALRSRLPSGERHGCWCCLGVMVGDDMVFLEFVGRS